MQTLDGGKTWQTASGESLKLPLTEAHNPALVHDYQADKLLVYTKDMKFDPKGFPVLLYSTSRGFEPGPENGDRMQKVARWNGSKWDIHDITKTDHNYDSASISFDEDGAWRVIAATEPGPQPYGTGGELVVWTSGDEGATWRKEKQLTNGSKLNQSYARRPVNAHPDFFSLWADGDARKPSESHIYFCNAKGDVFQLPTKMQGNTARPTLVVPPVATKP
jgi:hypothetical protein